MTNRGYLGKDIIIIEDFLWRGNHAIGLARTLWGSVLVYT